MAAFEALSVERRLLPRRVYRGAAGNLRRYFPLRLPVALDAEPAVFVYVDPGHETATALRSWGAAHRELWEALWDRGRGIEVVVVPVEHEPASASPQARVKPSVIPRHHGRGLPARTPKPSRCRPVRPV